MALVIKNAIIADIEHSFRGDVLIEGEKIAAVGSAIHASKAGVLDAAGKYLFPGGIDLNLSMSAGAADNDDLAAALYGGTTAASIACPTAPGCGVITDGSYIDLTPSGASGVFAALEAGTDDSGIFSLAAEAAERGGPLICRCENGALTAGLTGIMQKQQKTDSSMWPAVRPAYAEAGAVHRLLTAARAAGASVYIYCISTADALDEIISARRSGQTVYAGTCPHYLILTDELYKSTDAPLFTAAPPLRRQRDCERLWHALAQGDIDCISSDHHAFSAADKRSYGENVFTCPAGMPGIETRISLLFSEGVIKNRISPERFAAVTAGTPAEIAGLSGKGRIAAGMDADLILIDPSMKAVISAQRLHQKSDYTPYQGMELEALVTDVWLRGRHLIENRVMTDEAPHGRRAATNAAGKADLND
ncbi:MAG: amidohydrolase family protein [Synergistes sp.]|nr:amidohydrolase family protein [Synergistes sp.]